MEVVQAKSVNNFVKDAQTLMKNLFQLTLRDSTEKVENSKYFSKSLDTDHNRP